MHIEITPATIVERPILRNLMERTNMTSASSMALISDPWVSMIIRISTIIGLSLSGRLSWCEWTATWQDLSW